MPDTSSPNSLVSRIRNSSPVSYLRGLRHRGAAMVEMMMLLGLISLVALGAVGLTGGRVSHVFCEAAGTIDVSLGGKGFCLGKPAVSQAWIKSHTNPNFNPTFSFKDQLFAQGTSGTQTVMVPKTGDYTEAMTFSVAAPGPESFAACVEQNKGDTPVCGTASTSASSVTVAPTDYAVGYSVTLPGNTGQAVSDDIALTLATTTQDHLKKTWNINVGRTSTGQPFSTSMVFSDQTFPAGAIGNQHFVMVPVPAGFVAPLTFSVNGNGNVALAPCYEATSSATPVCTGSDQTGIQSETVSPSTYAIGYQVSLPSNNTTSDWSQQIALSLSEAGLTGSQSWTPTLSRPAGAVIFEPQMTFSDLSVPANTSGYETILVPIQGNFTTDLKWAADGQGVLSAAPCLASASNYNYQGFNQSDCPEPATTAKATTLWLTKIGNPYGYMGYTLNLGSSTQAGAAIDGTVNLTLTSTQDSSKTKTWPVHVTRPASPDAVSSNTSFPDLVLAAGSYGVSSKMESYSLNANFPTKFTFTASSDIPGTVEPCYQQSDVNLASCAASFTVNGGYTFGYNLDLASDPRPASAIDGHITLTATSVADPSVAQTWSVHVTRPAMTNVQAASASFADITAPANTNTKIAYQSTAYTAPASPNTYHLSVNGGGTLSVAPCYYNGSTQQCGAYSTDGSVSYAVGTSASQIGFSIDYSTISVFTAIDQNVTVTATSDQDPSVTKSWTVHVSRPVATPNFGSNTFADISVAPGTTSTTKYMANPYSAPNADYTLTSDGGTLATGACTQADSRSWGWVPVCTATTTGISSPATIAANSPGDSGVNIDFSSIPDTQAIDQNITLTGVSQKDTSYTKTWTIHVSRPAVTAPSATFADLSLAAGDTSQTVELASAYTPSTTNIYLWTDGQGTLSVRPVYTSSTTTYYGAYATGKSSAQYFSPSATSIGFEVDASSIPPAEAIDQTITVTAVSSVDHSVTQTWTIHVTRPAAPATVASATFPTSLDFAAGTNALSNDTSSDNAINWASAFADANGPVTLTTDAGSAASTSYGTPTMTAAPCRIASNGAGTCGSFATGQSSTTTLNTDRNIGFRLNLGDPMVAVDQNMTITETAQADPTVTKSWTVHVTRPAETPVIGTATFNDVTLAAYNGSTHEAAGSYSGQNSAWTLTTNGNGGVQVQPYYQVSGYYTYKGTSSAGQSSLQVAGNASGFGFIVDSSNVSPDQAVNQDITLTATSIYDPTVTRTWTVHISRPAVTTAQLLGSVTMPASVATLSPGQKVKEYVWDTGYTDPYTTTSLSSDGAGILSVTPCDNSYGYVTCGRASTGTSSLSYNTSENGVGFYLDTSSAPEASAIDTYVTLTESVPGWPSIAQSQQVHITRPAETYPSDSDLSGLDGTWPVANTAVQKMVVVDGMFNFAPKISTNPTTNGSEYAVPCYQATSTSAVQCDGYWSTSNETITAPVNPYAIGYETNMNPFSSGQSGTIVFTISNGDGALLTHNITVTAQ